jgi:hypothetical protein
VKPSRRSAATEFLLRQAPLLVLADAIYVAVRAVTEGAPARAVANAEHLVRFERRIGLDWEHAIQDVVLRESALVDFFNWVYVWMYWPFIVAGIVILFVVDRVRYRLARNAIFLSGSIGMVIFATIPVAPPRFMPGYVGTVSEAARQHFVTSAPHWVNRYAALPSFHAGWTMAVSVVLASMCTSKGLRVLALMPGVLMTVAVVATGNHYVVDVVLGDTISLGCLWGFAWRERWQRVARADAPMVSG